jgi:hypothetical protein
MESHQVYELENLKALKMQVMNQFWHVTFFVNFVAIELTGDEQYFIKNCFINTDLTRVSLIKSQIRSESMQGWHWVMVSNHCFSHTSEIT